MIDRLDHKLFTKKTISKAFEQAKHVRSNEGHKYGVLDWAIVSWPSENGWQGVVPLVDLYHKDVDRASRNPTLQQLSFFRTGFEFLCFLHFGTY